MRYKTFLKNLLNNIIKFQHERQSNCKKIDGMKNLKFLIFKQFFFIQINLSYDKEKRIQQLRTKVGLFHSQKKIYLTSKKKIAAYENKKHHENSI